MGQKLSSPLLTLIRSTSHRPLPQHLLKRLLQTQKNLRHLEILPSGAVDAHHDPNTKDGCTTITDSLKHAGLEQLQSVRVVPDMPQVAALCIIALQKGNSQGVISLEVDARHWVDAAHFTHAQNSMATKDQLVESLFENSGPRLSRSLSRTSRRTLGRVVFSATRGGISTRHRANSSILSRKKGGTGRARRILGQQMVHGRPLLLAVDGCECEKWILGVE